MTETCHILIQMTEISKKSHLCTIWFKIILISKIFYFLVTWPLRKGGKGLATKKNNFFGGFPYLTKVRALMLILLLRNWNNTECP